VIRQYSPGRQNQKQNNNREKVSLRIGLPLVLTIGPCGFGFQIGNLPARLRNLPLQTFLVRSRCQLK
jgi:hypothetical protein